MKNTLESLAGRINGTAQDLEIMLQDAHHLLEGDDMPEPYDQWEDAAWAASSAAADISINDDIIEVVSALNRAAKKMPK